jgi:hypothetical protein
MQGDLERARREREICRAVGALLLTICMAGAIVFGGYF